MERDQTRPDPAKNEISANLHRRRSPTEIDEDESLTSAQKVDEWRNNIRHKIAESGHIPIYIPARIWSYGATADPVEKDESGLKTEEETATATGEINLTGEDNSNKEQTSLTKESVPANEGIDKKGNFPSCKRRPSEDAQKFREELDPAKNENSADLQKSKKARTLHSSQSLDEILKDFRENTNPTQSRANWRNLPEAERRRGLKEYIEILNSAMSADMQKKKKIKEDEMRRHLEKVVQKSPEELDRAKNENSANLQKKIEEDERSRCLHEIIKKFRDLYPAKNESSADSQKKIPEDERRRCLDEIIQKLRELNLAKNESSADLQKIKEEEWCRSINELSDQFLEELDPTKHENIADLMRNCREDEEKNRALGEIIQKYQKKLLNRLAEKPSQFENYSHGFHTVHSDSVAKPERKLSYRATEDSVEKEESGLRMEEETAMATKETNLTEEVNSIERELAYKRIAAKKRISLGGSAHEGYKEGKQQRTSTLVKPEISSTEKQQTPVKGKCYTVPNKEVMEKIKSLLNEKPTRPGPRIFMVTERKSNAEEKRSQDEEIQTNESRNGDENQSGADEAEVGCSHEGSEAKEQADVSNINSNKNQRQRTSSVGKCLINRDARSKKLHREMRKKLQKIQMNPKIPKILADTHFEKAMDLIDLPDGTDSESEDIETSSVDSGDDEMENKDVDDDKARTKEYFHWPNSLLTTTLTTVADSLQKIQCQCQETALRSPNEASGRDETLRKVRVVKTEQNGEQVFQFDVPQNNVLDNVTVKINHGSETSFQISGVLTNSSEEERILGNAWRAIARAKLLKYKRQLRHPDAFGRGRDSKLQSVYNKCREDELKELIYKSEKEVREYRKYYANKAIQAVQSNEYGVEAPVENEQKMDEDHELEAKIEGASNDLEFSRNESSSSEDSWEKLDINE